jgi:hypothetical protein
MALADTRSGAFAVRTPDPGNQRSGELTKIWLRLSHFPWASDDSIHDSRQLLSSGRSRRYYAARHITRLLIPSKNLLRKKPMIQPLRSDHPGWNELVVVLRELRQLTDDWLDVRAFSGRDQTFPKWSFGRARRHPLVGRLPIRENGNEHS